MVHSGMDNGGGGIGGGDGAPSVRGRGWARAGVWWSPWRAAGSGAAAARPAGGKHRAQRQAGGQAGEEGAGPERVDHG